MKDFKRKRIGVIFGGRSGEHEVSLLSAASVIRHLDREKFEPVLIGITREGKWKKFDGTTEEIEDGSWEGKAEDYNVGNLAETVDFALPIMHGPYCEDGKIQGLFEMMDIPYGGCGVMASAAAMDKAIAKDIFIQHSIPVTEHVFATKADVEENVGAIVKEVEEEFGYPCFVKPVNMGSSVGVSKASDKEELIEALNLACQYDKRIIIEKGVNCRELEVGVIGNVYPEASAIGEILSEHDFYDYSSKYTDGMARLAIPADIPEATAEMMKKVAIKAYKAIDGEGFARVDFFIDRNNGEIYLNEINTIPGFTKYSMFPLLWEEAGVKYHEQLERIIELGYERYNNKNKG